MKTMTCKQLGGACDEKFTAPTFNEIAALSNKHGTEMFKKGDEAHISAMHEMKKMMENPDAMNDWFEKKKQEFESLPED